MMTIARRLGLLGTAITLAVAVIGLTPTVLAQSQSSDATLSALTLSDVNFGTFASSTTTYTASVANRVRKTTVTPTANQSGATYVVELDGTEDSDGEVSLSVGSNVITVEVTAEDGNTTQTYTVTVTRAANSPATGTPTISGTAEVGETLTADMSSIADADGIATLPGGGTWQLDWKGDCGRAVLTSHVYENAPIAWANEERKKLVIPWQSVGSAIWVEVGFYDEGGDYETIDSARTAIVPGPVVGLTLVDTSDQSDVQTVNCDDSQPIVLDANGSYSIRAELADGAELGSISWDFDYGEFTRSDNTAPYSLYGENGDSDLLGRALGSGSHDIDGTVYSSIGGPVQNLFVKLNIVHNSPATGAPTITGTAQVGQTLTADTSDISDPDGLTSVSYSYQWLADDAEIDGAASSTYTVQSSDNGKVIKVRVSFTDDGGSDESVTSAGTSAVVLGGL